MFKIVVVQCEVDQMKCEIDKNIEKQKGRNYIFTVKQGFVKF